MRRVLRISSNDDVDETHLVEGSVGSVTLAVAISPGDKVRVALLGQVDGERVRLHREYCTTGVTIAFGHQRPQQPGTQQPNPEPG